MKPIKLSDDDLWWTHIYNSRDVVWVISETLNWMRDGDFRHDGIEWAITRDR